MDLPLRIIVDDSGLAGIAYLEDRMEPSAIGRFMMGSTTQYLQERAQLRFDNEGDSASGMWPALSDASEQMRAWMADKFGYAIGPSHPINVRSGELRSWVTESQAGGAHAGAGGGWMYLYPNHLPGGELGEKVRTAARGKDEPRTDPRPVLVLDEVDETVITGLIGGWLLGND